MWYVDDGTVGKTVEVFEVRLGGGCLRGSSIGLVFE